MLVAMHLRGSTGDERVVMRDLDEQQFHLWASLLEQRLGIAVTDERRVFLSSRLRMRMRALGCEDIESYYSLVSSPREGSQEWSRLLDQITIHETRFNRHPGSFRLIEEVYLPQLMQRVGQPPDVRAWSVGCASGEEAYYLAMVLDRAMSAQEQKGYYGVIGSDISLEVLSQARLGIYPHTRLVNLDSEMLESYFEPHEDLYRVVDRIRQRVAFSQVNVQNLAHVPFEKMDIIFCQNLLIYFSMEKRREIVGALSQFLKPGGMLVLGIGEIVGWRPEGVETVKFEDTLAYRRVKG